MLRICSCTRSNTLIGPILRPFFLPNEYVLSLSLSLRPFKGTSNYFMAQQATHLPWECLSTLYFKKKLMVSSSFIRAIFISKSSPSWLLSSPGLLNNLCGMWILMTSDSGTCMALSVSHMLCGLCHTQLHSSTWRRTSCEHTGLIFEWH